MSSAKTWCPQVAHCPCTVFPATSRSSAPRCHHHCLPTPSHTPACLCVLSHTSPCSALQATPLIPCGEPHHRTGHPAVPPLPSLTLLPATPQVTPAHPSHTETQAPLAPPLVSSGLPGPRQERIGRPSPHRPASACLGGGVPPLVYCFLSDTRRHRRGQLTRGWLGHGPHRRPAHSPTTASQQRLPEISRFGPDFKTSMLFNTTS